MKATDTVEVPSRNSAVVSLAPRPNFWSMAMNRAVPSGRARKARAKTAKDSSVPPTGPAKGKISCGNTTTEAMA